MPEKFIVEVVNNQIVGQPTPYQPGMESQSTGGSMSIFSLVMFFILGVIVLIALVKSVVIVKQQTAKVIERLGKYRKIAVAGLNFKIPFIDKMAGEVDLRVQQLLAEVETKTKDNVFVHIKVAVQYNIVATKVYEAFYQLDNPKQQITSFIFDVVRSKVPTLTLDQTFENKNDIAESVKKELTETMEAFGYHISTALVVDISPEEKVKSAMNEINAQQRLQVAATARGESEKILIVKKAEAEAESKKLQGEGIANQRKAIISGLRESMKDLSEATGVSTHEVMGLVMMTQYFDTIKEIGVGEGNKTIFLPSSPDGVNQFADQIRTSIISANQVK